jgi:pimeloyl-ACP methyl ester carboxylesterase
VGDIDNFTPSRIVAGIHHVMITHAMLLLNNENGNNVVVVGHIMGWWMAMSYAAACPKQVSDLVIEDMDFGRHILNIDIPIAKIADRELTVNFQRKFEFNSYSNSRKYTFDRLEAVEYPTTMVQGW